jgi:hypothetical protein
MDQRSHPSRSASESGLFSGILVTRSQDSDDYRNVVEKDSNPSTSSSMVQQPKMISGRGALISGYAIPQVGDDSESDEPDEDEEAEYEGEDDLENGVEPPDSDYASYAPPNIFPRKSVAERKVSTPRLKSKPMNFPITTIKMDHTERPLESEESTEMHNSTKEKKRPPNLWCGLAIFSALLMAAVAVVGLVVTGRMDRTTLTDRQREIGSIVTSLVDSSTLNDKNSSQAKANQWLVYDDKLWVDEKETLSREQIMQRYVLALFYFATTGSSWVENNWLDGNECSGWTGISCNENGQVQSLVLGTSLTANRTLLILTSRTPRLTGSPIVFHYLSRAPRPYGISSVRDWPSFSSGKFGHQARPGTRGHTAIVYWKAEPPSASCDELHVGRNYTS